LFERSRIVDGSHTPQNPPDWKLYFRALRLLEVTLEGGSNRQERKIKMCCTSKKGGALPTGPQGKFSLELGTWKCYHTMVSHERPRGLQ